MNIGSVETIFGGSLNKHGAILPEVSAKEAGVGSLVLSRRAGWGISQPAQEAERQFNNCSSLAFVDLPLSRKTSGIPPP
jgi:hypothetical protein